MPLRGKKRAKAGYMISAVAELYKLHPQTLRLYERVGLLKPSRSQGNTRLYTDEDLERHGHTSNLARVPPSVRPSRGGTLPPTFYGTRPDVARRGGTSVAKFTIGKTNVSYRPIVGHSFSPIGGQAFSPEWGPPVFGR